MFSPSIPFTSTGRPRSEEHTSELQSQSNLVCRLLLEKKKKHTYSPMVRDCADYQSLFWSESLRATTTRSSAQRHAGLSGLELNPCDHHDRFVRSQPDT